MELRNILKDFNLNQITPQNINDIGKAVYADKRAKSNLVDLNEIMTAWQMVHAPLSGFWIHNGTLGNITVQYSISDTTDTLLIAVTDVTTVAAGVSIFIPTFSGITLYLDANTTAYGHCSEADMDMGVITNLISQ